MSEFKNVTVVREASIYFEGKVTSRTVLFLDASRKTLGVMLPGEYEFGTSSRESIEILVGELEVLLPEANAWEKVSEGETFEAPPHSRFKLKVKTVTDYCCSYID